MRFFKSKDPPGLTEDLIQRVWDLGGRIKQLEDRFDGQLDELSKRYRRAEQSEARLERKKDGDCEDCPEEEVGGSLAQRALRARHLPATGGIEA